MANGALLRYQSYRRRKQNKRPKAAPRWMMALAFLAVIVAVGIGVAAATGYSVYQGYADDLVPPDKEIAKLPSGGARIYDRNGTLLYEFLDENFGLRDPVSADEISLWLVLATIASEDATFMTNPGVNYRGLASAAWENFWPFGDDAPGFLEGRGGSSITQQLVKNVYFTPDERTERSIERKVKETVYALELTDQYSKEQIMTWYLNQISYGNIFVGIKAASNGYFNKDPRDLTLAEAATLAAIPACPTCYDPIAEPEAAVAQRNVVLRRMYEEGFFDPPGTPRGSPEAKAMLWEASSQPLEVDLQPTFVQAPHFVFNVVQPALEGLFGEEAVRRDGLVVTTSLDLGEQRVAEDILENWITTFEYSGGHNGAVVAIDPNTAEILVYVGSRDYFREDIDGQNDMAAALNSPGSAFKPFTYLTAFMNLGWGPGTLLLDTPFPTEFWDGERPPRNPGTGYQGPLTIRKSLGNSLNIPAVKTIMYAGVSNVITQAKKMGITTLDDRQLGPSLTVGGVDVKLVDMVYGFTAFPNLGLLKGVQTTVSRADGNRALDPISILKVEDRSGNQLYPAVENGAGGNLVVQETRVAPPQETYLINSILSDSQAHCITYGCGGLTIPGRPVGIKTGTSEPYETINAIGDTWTIGYTPQIVVGTWFGNADNSPMFDISSTSVSLRTVKDLLIEYHQDLPVLQFERPDGLVQATACLPSYLKPTDACPLRTENDLVAAHSVPQKDDDWWTTTEIDSRTGLLPSDLTPDEYVVRASFLNLPANLTAWERNQALEWGARASGGGEAPTEQTTDDDLPVLITSPANGARVQGVVEITGRAGSLDFQNYRLEYSIAGDDDWELISISNRQVTDGTLGSWDTTGLEPGLYTLRLLLLDEERGEIAVRVGVLVVVPGPPTPTPFPLPPTATPVAEARRAPMAVRSGRGPTAGS